MNRLSDTQMSLIDWDRLAVSLVRYDARGHGESASTPDLAGYSWAEMALDQLALADALDLGDYICGGASMGCGTALHVACLAPARVNALVLVIPPTGWETRAAQAEQWQLTAELIETEGVEPVIAARAELDPPDPFVGDATRREQQAAWTRAWDPLRLAHVMRGATHANLPERERVAAIEIPALILAWTGDPIHPVSTAEELLDLMPNSQLDLASTRAEVDGWTDRVADFLRSAR